METSDVSDTVAGGSVTGGSVAGGSVAGGRGGPARAGGSLSPSRAADFKQCPLLYRFRVVDRIPEAPSSAAVRGTVVHLVLERLFDLSPDQRTVAAARGLLAGALDDVLRERPEAAVLFEPGTRAAGGEGDATGGGTAGGTAGGAARDATWPAAPAPPNGTPVDVDEWLAEAARLVERWFDLEDPRRLQPAARELLVEHQVTPDLLLRGVVDRLDEAPDGRLRVVDYKTGRAPSEAFESKALFQMKFYALLLWRSRGRVPSRVQLVYVGGDGDTLPLDVDAGMLAAFERTLLTLWEAIRTAARTGDWRPRTSRLCDWCDHKVRCPAWGGTPPPLPPDAESRVLGLIEPDVPGQDES